MVRADRVRPGVRRPALRFRRLGRLLDRLDARFLVAEAAEAVAGSDHWEQQRVKRYGRTWVTFLARLTAIAAPEVTGGGVAPVV